MTEDAMLGLFAILSALGLLVASFVLVLFYELLKELFYDEE